MKLFSYVMAGGLLMSLPVLAYAQGDAAPAEPQTAPEVKQPEKTPPKEVKQSANKAETGYKARHDVKGEITDVDKSTGELSMKTAEGDLKLSFPPSAVQKLEKGDEVSVQLAIKPMAKPSKTE